MPHTQRPKRGRNPNGPAKLRTNISLSPGMMKAVTMLGEKLFGNRNAYVEFALLQDLRAQGLTVDRILELAAQWEKENTSEGGGETK
jgi:hypothetical protein